MKDNIFYTYHRLATTTAINKHENFITKNYNSKTFPRYKRFQIIEKITLQFYYLYPIEKVF